MRGQARASKPKRLQVLVGPDGRSTVQVQVGPPTTMTRRLIAMLPTVLGAAILLGGPGRFVTPSFAVPRGFAPWWVWGAMFLLTGLAMCFRSWQSSEGVFWPAFTAACMFMVWTIGLGASALFGPNHGVVAFTGTAIYAWGTVALAATAARDPRSRNLLKRDRRE